MIVKNSDSGWGNVVCALGGTEPKSPCLRGFVMTAGMATYVCEGDVRYESYDEVCI